MSDPDFSATPQLLYAIGNPDAAGTIYVSANPADNQLSLVMSATAAASFVPGPLVPPAQIPPIDNSIQANADGTEQSNVLWTLGGTGTVIVTATTANAQPLPPDFFFDVALVFLTPQQPTSEEWKREDRAWTR